MATDFDARPIVTQFTDLMCTWCWGAEPIVRHLHVAYGDQLRFEYVMGGLVRDFEEFYDAANDISTPAEAAPHWLEASRAHGMPVETRVLKENPPWSTYPANIAFMAARLQDREVAHRYLRRLREAYATEGINVSDRETQIRLTESIGLDTDAFIAALNDGRAREAFEADLDRARSAAVLGFPSYRVAGPSGERLAAGFQSFGALVAHLESVANDLDRSSPPPIREFVIKWGPIATQEVAEVYDLALSKARQVLQSLADNGAVRSEPRGNGFFWHADEGGKD